MATPLRASLRLLLLVDSRLRRNDGRAGLVVRSQPESVTVQTDSVSGTVRLFGPFANGPYSHVSSCVTRATTEPRPCNVLLRRGTVVEIFADHHYGAARVAGYALG